MNNEDDTFRKLKRDPADRIMSRFFLETGLFFIYLTGENKECINICEDGRLFVEENGWTKEEFLKELTKIKQCQI